MHRRAAVAWTRIMPNRAAVLWLTCLRNARLLATQTGAV